MNQSKQRAFLKWAGGKYRLADTIKSHMPSTGRLVEPFVGAGSVFLNTQFERYWLNDVNADLINLYEQVRDNAESLLAAAESLFIAENNDAEAYYRLRERFNHLQDPFERALVFLYLNRHCYNGLCRYNKSGHFNVPFGRYVKPYFPADELRHFASRVRQAKLTQWDYRQVFAKLQPDDVIYCDPPYAPISATANFTDYASGGFGLEDQQALAQLAQRAAERGNWVLISNHDTAFTREIYAHAELVELKVWRSISQNSAKRETVGELLALYRPRG